MLATATAQNHAANVALVGQPKREVSPAGNRIAESLKLINDTLAVTRRLLHAGDSVYEAGERFESLHVVNSGIFKLVNLSPDGREQVVGLQFKGDWLGFDGIATGRHSCDAVAMDTGEVWTVRYDSLLQASARQPALMAVMHGAMSREMTRDRDALLSICTLPADARVAEFLHNWASSLSERGLRTDQITLRMTRAEIGNYLGMKLETVSRALSRLARDGIIEFSEGGRRDVRIPDLGVLSACVQRCVAPEGMLQ
ncbi:Crp/Fnr family transcriptional regulator [Piscinibacter gummiphilus]|uniref:Helix-turn-helix domain-containing protein n=1 Tax=Piscinibacter gummiphilus TaxID=946333 RepID=A0ABZ0CSH9_9BURK|nr:helix-turn-helix domain-containing protein [Piscinibacter gummiphilus]WOB06041.1 helix-turn-helix domain-containing protein [Piscinibacter gummiphilus]